MPWWGWAIIGIAIGVAVIWLRGQIQRGRLIRYDKDLSEALDIIGETLQRRKVLIDKWNSVQHLPDDALIQQNPPVTKDEFVQAALHDHRRHLKVVNDAQFRFMMYLPPEPLGPVQDAMFSLFATALHELIVPLDDSVEQAATYAHTQHVIAAYNDTYRAALTAIS